MIVLAALAPRAEASRPTDLVGLYAFTAEDVVTSWDDPTGAVRVHFSTAGPNRTELADADADAVPDYVELAGEFAAQAIALYADLGFLPPTHESDVGLGPLGGTDAWDVYLVDFDGSGDGNFQIDGCASGRCAGALLVENDFFGYGYPSDRTALSVVVPHELFHGVQYSYSAELEVWASEGTATWAERQFDPASADFMGLAGNYLDEPTRSLDEPPVGPVPAFAYATALWFDFLTLTHDPQLVVEILEGWSDRPQDPPLEPLLDAVRARGVSVGDTWATFAQWNLATGPLGGAFDGYPYAERIGPVLLEDEGRRLDDDNRFYPLATTYYRLTHDGGPLWFGLEEPAPGLVFGLHPTNAEGEVLAPALIFTGEDATVRSLGDLPAGDWYLWGAQPEDGPESIKVRFCAGPEDDVTACFAPVVDDTDALDTGTDDAERGCGCAGGPSGAPVTAVFAAAALGRARRRRR